MKFVTAFFSFLILIFLLFNFVSFGNVYSSQLSFTNQDGSPFDGKFDDGTGAAFNFFLNDTASSVSIEVKDVENNSVVATIDGGARSSGEVTIEWDGAGTEQGKFYYFEITAEQPSYSNTEWTYFYDSGGIGIFSRGGDVVTDMKSDLFGLFYAPNNGGPLGKGITIYNPDGSYHDPFLVAADISSGGTIDWGTGDPMVGGFFDDLGRFYVSSIQFGEIRRLNRDSSITAVVTGLTTPKGIFIRGTGNQRIIYACAANQILKISIGDEDIFLGTPEVIAEFSGGFPKDVALDDEGFLYTNLRATDNDLNATGAGLYKFSLAGTLPVVDADAIWGIGEAQSHKVAELQFDFGTDRNSASDDILYYSTRAETANNDDGIWKVDDLNAVFATSSPIITELELYGADDNINARAGIMLDAAGNLILMENSNEHIFFITPPNAGATNSFTTASRDSFMVDFSLGINDNQIPNEFVLKQNYPNPFNPSTNIQFSIPKESNVTLTVYNSLGEEAATLINNVRKSSGTYDIHFDASGLPSGIYIYRLQAGNKTLTNKMIFMK
ncbi:MAG: FlgD immunoglobulin-like domain containing protein [Ignavibacteriaceae bacterium]